MKWVSYVAAVFFGVALGKISESLGVPPFRDSPEGEGYIWLAGAVILGSIYLYLQRKGEASPPDSV